MRVSKILAVLSTLSVLAGCATAEQPAPRAGCRRPPGARRARPARKALSSATSPSQCRLRPRWCAVRRSGELAAPTPTRTRARRGEQLGRNAVRVHLPAPGRAVGARRARSRVAGGCGTELGDTTVATGRSAPDHRAGGVRSACCTSGLGSCALRARCLHAACGQHSDDPTDRPLRAESARFRLLDRSRGHCLLAGAPLTAPTAATPTAVTSTTVTFGTTAAMRDRRAPMRSAAPTG